MNDNVLDVLQAAGLLSDTNGGLVLTGVALKLRDSWIRFLAQFARRFSAEYFAAPLFIAEETLAQAGYLDHFPQNVFAANSYQNSAQQPRFITPAACLHLYPRLNDQALAAAPFVGFVLARCARYEGGKWQFPFRMAEFQMAELVVVGAAAYVAGMYAAAQAALVSELQRLGLPGELKVATDAFFLGNDDGARIMQKLKELKKEYVVSSAGQDVAVASLNKHEDYFARRFGLGGSGKDVVSFCLAFGVERLVACSLLQWGAVASGWPEELR